MKRALDLFCKAGGVTKGLQRAGFHVTGVDIEPQKNYRGDVFIQADALTVPLDYECDDCGGSGNLYGPNDEDGDFLACDCDNGRKAYDFIWASPPCQGYSALRHLPWLKDKVYPLLIDPMRERLLATGKPYCIENVERAPLKDGFMLCGQMFGLPIYRHRLFETNWWPGLLPEHQKHTQVIGHGRMVNDRRKGSLNNSSAKGAWGKQNIITVAGGQFKKADGVRAMQIDWMNKDELAQAIPPAYSEFIGKKVLEVM